MLLPSILQSTSSGFSVKRMLFTLVPRLMTIDEPFTFKSLMTVTASPSNNSAPLLSLATSMVSVAVASSSLNSCAQSGHTYKDPSKYTYSPPHYGHLVISLMTNVFYVFKINSFISPPNIPKQSSWFPLLRWWLHRWGNFPNGRFEAVEGSRWQKWRRWWSLRTNR